MKKHRSHAETPDVLTHLDDEIIRVLTASGAPLTSAELLEEIPDCPDRETLARAISKMMMAGKLTRRNVFPKSSTFACGSVTAYTLPSKAAQKPQQDPAKATVAEVAAEPVKEAVKEPAKTTQRKPRTGMTIKEQIAEMVRGIPESLAISKEDIIRHLKHIKRGCITTAIPQMVNAGDILAAIGNTNRRRFFDIRTKGAEVKKPDSASVIIPEKTPSYEIAPPLGVEKSVMQEATSVMQSEPLFMHDLPHAMRQPDTPDNPDPVFALDTNGRLRIEQGEHIILCETATVRKLALLLSIGQHVY